MKRVLTLIGAFILVLSASATTAAADSDSTPRFYFAGSGPVCGLGPSACPSIAMADNGDTIEIALAGTFSLHPKTVTGGGTFMHKDASGTVLAIGTVTATEVLAFHSYGTDSTIVPGVTLEGGQLRIAAHLVGTTAGDVTVEADAIIEIDCAISVPPPGNAADTVRVNVQGLINFNKPVSGLTVYIPLP